MPSPDLLFSTLLPFADSYYHILTIAQHSTHPGITGFITHLLPKIFLKFCQKNKICLKIFINNLQK